MYSTAAKTANWKFLFTLVGVGNYLHLSETQQWLVHLALFEMKMVCCMVTVKLDYEDVINTFTNTSQDLNNCC